MIIILILFFVAVVAYAIYTNRLINQQQKTIDKLAERDHENVTDYNKLLKNSHEMSKNNRAMQFNYELILDMVGVDVSGEVTDMVESIGNAVERSGLKPHSISNHGRELVVKANEDGLISDELMEKYLSMKWR